ncbi:MULTISPECIES: hypothetical protein [Halomonas]|nr:hypothetical protein [Halomonas salina]
MFIEVITVGYRFMCHQGAIAGPVIGWEGRRREGIGNPDIFVYKVEGAP